MLRRAPLPPDRDTSAGRPVEAGRRRVRASPLRAGPTR
jgi:hypothetical protein